MVYSYQGILFAVKKQDFEEFWMRGEIVHEILLNDRILDCVCVSINWKKLREGMKPCLKGSEQ